MRRRLWASAFLIAGWTASGVAVAASLPGDLTPAATTEAIGRHLDSVVLPYWADPVRLTEPAAWEESVGIPVIRQLRLLYVHAIAVSRQEDRATRERLREQYDRLLLDLVARYRTAEGIWLTSVTSGGGEAAIEDRQAISQAYVVYVMAECARLISDSRARELAIEAFALLDERAHDLESGGYVERMDLPLAAPANQARQLGTLMHIALGLARLHRIAPSALYRERLRELRDIFIEHALVPRSGNAYMAFDRDWEPAPVGEDSNQQTLYGHNAELLWYTLDVLDALGDDPEDYLPWLRRVARGVMRNGVGPDGRVYTWGPWIGPPEDRNNVRWWPHAEAALMLARMYQLTGDDAFRRQRDRVLRFTFEHFAPADPGPWHSDCNPATGVTVDGLSEPWKAGLHTVRMLAELERILGESEAVPIARRQRRALGRTVQLEPGFAYWRDRSAESIVSEVKANGFECILLICTTDKVDPPDLIEVAHQARLEVWGTFFPSGVYMPDELFPPNHDEWLMQFAGDGFSDYRFFSYVHRDYMEWWKAHLARMYEAYDFDGMLWYEVHYPTIHGPTSWGGPSTFGDVSPGFVEAFQRHTGRRDFPSFTDPGDPSYYETDTTLYDDYVEFRVNSIVDFHREVLDGDNGFRRRFPEVPFATWTIALNDEGGPAVLRENEAQDAARVVGEMRPDLHFLQSHSPDWARHNQTPEYVRGYVPYIRAIEGVDSGLPVGIQADVCSTCSYRRSPDWMAAFETECHALGVETTTYYEFSLRWEVYNTAPVAVDGSVSADGTGIVVFDQRIDPEGCRALEGRQIAERCAVEDVTVDGSLLHFRLVGRVPEGVVRLPVEGITDSPTARFPLAGGDRGEANAIREGRTVRLATPPARGR